MPELDPILDISIVNLTVVELDHILRSTTGNCTVVGLDPILDIPTVKQTSP
jgi:hypothetical protein